MALEWGLLLVYDAMVQYFVVTEIIVPLMAAGKLVFFPLFVFFKVLKWVSPFLGLKLAKFTELRKFVKYA